MLKLVLFAGVAVCFFVCMTGFGLAAETRVTKSRIKELKEEQKKKALQPFQLDILRRRTFQFVGYDVPLKQAYLIALLMSSISGGLAGLLWLVAMWIG